jgi:hypothetical protein
MGKSGEQLNTNSSLSAANCHEASAQGGNQTEVDRWKLIFFR